jgi:hypothetical protein
LVGGGPGHLGERDRARLRRPARSFRGVLDHLATMSRDTLVYEAFPDHPIDALPTPTELQARAFELIGAPIPTTLTP